MLGILLFQQPTTLLVGLGLEQWRNSLGDGKFEPRTLLSSLGVCQLWYC